MEKLEKLMQYIIGELVDNNSETRITYWCSRWYCYIQSECSSRRDGKNNMERMDLQLMQ